LIGVHLGSSYADRCARPPLVSARAQCVQWAWVGQRGACLEQADDMDVVVGVEREPVVDARRLRQRAGHDRSVTAPPPVYAHVGARVPHQDEQVPRLDADADPAVLRVAHVKVPAAVQNAPNLLVLVQMPGRLCESTASWPGVRVWGGAPRTLRKRS
jgi:hypothetical protein